MVEDVRSVGDGEDELSVEKVQVDALFDGPTHAAL